MARIEKTSAPLDYRTLTLNSEKAQYENNDCTVKAVALVCQVSYEVAHAELARLGRRPGKGCNASVWLLAIRNLGFELRCVHPHEIISRFPSSHQKLKGLTSHHPRRFPKHWDNSKVYVARSSGHAFAIIKGETQDWSINKVLRIRSIWEVSPK
jgi:hypothetical protein